MNGKQKSPYDDTIRIIDEQVLPNIDHLIDVQLHEIYVDYEQNELLDLLLKDMGLRKKEAGE